MKQQTWILVLVLLLSCVSLDRFLTLLRLNFFIYKMKKQPFPLTNTWKLPFTIALFHCFCWNTRRQKLCCYLSPFFLNYTWVNQAPGRWVIFCRRAHSWDPLSSTSIFPGYLLFNLWTLPIRPRQALCYTLHTPFSLPSEHIAQL